MSDSEVEEQLPQGREIGDYAVWTLSSAKPGYGIEQLRDDTIDTFWQSDGNQPHFVNIQFSKKTTIQEIAIYLFYQLDESYTPNKISIRAGSTVHDLIEIRTMELEELNGWIRIPLYSTPHNGHEPLKTYFLQLIILSMHQNGRDTHIRQIKVYTPRDSTALQPSSVAFSCYSCIR